MGRPYVSPPAVPVERLKALRSTFMKLMKDESFLKDAKKMKLEINPVGGEEVQRIVASMFAAPQDVIEASKQAVK
jgi:tripartite-type tricarboxylate transporter receptor subunit TctC